LMREYWTRRTQRFAKDAKDSKLNKNGCQRLPDKRKQLSI